METSDVLERRYHSRGDDPAVSGRKAWHVSIDCPIRHSRGPSAAVSWVRE